MAAVKLAVKIAGRTLAAGSGAGPVVPIAPLSFWGGYDPATGRIIDRLHPANGTSLAGVVLVMAQGRGSSSASGAIAEAIRLGTAPSAIVLAKADAILLIGVLAAEALYGRGLPIVVVSPGDHARLAATSRAAVTATGDSATIVAEWRA
jgi:predicted aconitase with swiveling domain